ncbi:MAG: cell wall hydrolase [Pseudomonadota bacterium]
MIKKTINLVVAFSAFFALASNANALILPMSGMSIFQMEHFERVSEISLQQLAKSNEKEKQEHCLTLALYHEARGEPLAGQYAVGATILNRVRSSVYPNTICGVVYQNAHLKNRCQFSFACDDRTDTPANSKSHKVMKRISKLMLNGNLHEQMKFSANPAVEFVEDMTHYHRHDVYPVWSKKLARLAGIGNHVFFRSNRVTRRYVSLTTVKW